MVTQIQRFSPEGIARAVLAVAGHQQSLFAGANGGYPVPGTAPKFPGTPELLLNSIIGIAYTVPRASICSSPKLRGTAELHGTDPWNCTHPSGVVLILQKTQRCLFFCWRPLNWLKLCQEGKRWMEWEQDSALLFA